MRLLMLILALVTPLTAVAGPQVTPGMAPTKGAPSLAYGEMYVDGGGAITINTANVPHPITTLITGHVDHDGLVTFTANATGAITAYTTASGGAATNVADAAHGLTDQETVCISDSTNYNGCHTITFVDAGNFTIAVAFAGDDGASNWIQGDSLTVGLEGDYELVASFSLTKAAGVSTTAILQAYVGSTAKANCKTTREIATADTGALMVSCILDDLENGDVVFLTYQGDSTNNVTTTNANIALHLIH